MFITEDGQNIAISKKELNHLIGLLNESGGSATEIEYKINDNNEFKLYVGVRRVEERINVKKG